MNDDEIGAVWIAALQPTTLQRHRIEARVFAWIEASDTSLAAEWLGLFRVAPFSAVGLVTVSAIAIAVTSPLLWLASALI
jgi:hypothetical protein